MIMWAVMTGEDGDEFDWDNVMAIYPDYASAANDLEVSYNWYAIPIELERVG